MKPEVFLDSINDIRDEYIAEYEQKKPRLSRSLLREKPPSAIRWLRVVAFAACLCLILLIWNPFALFHSTGGLGDGLEKGFTYEELMDFLPEDSILRKMPLDPDGSFHGMGWYYENKRESDITAYNFFRVELVYEGHAFVIHADLRSPETEEAFIKKETVWKNRYPNRSFFTMVSEHTVFCIKDYRQEQVTARFVHEGTVYSVTRYGFTNPDPLLDFVGIMLGRQ